MLTDCRKDFPILKKKVNGFPLVYLDSAATALKPAPVVESIHHYYSHVGATVHRAVYALAREAQQAYDQAREKVQQFIHASFPEEIIFTRGTTASLNLLARSFSKIFLHPGDRVLVTEAEHHSNFVPWQMVCKDSGAELLSIPLDDAGCLDLNAFKRLLTPRVKIVSLAHISNVLGTLHPVQEVIEMAHSSGALVCLDGAQSAPRLPIDVQNLNVDFYAFSGHKLYGPNGVGVLYGKRDLLDQMPPIEGGGDMIDRVSLAETSYNELPLKFEAGTPMIAEVIGLGSAVDYLLQWGKEEIWKHETMLLSYATEKLLSVPRIRIIGTAGEKGAIISFIVRGAHPLDLASLLDSRGIAVRSGHQCSQPAMDRFGIEHCLRVSFGIYTTKNEIDFFYETLVDLLNYFT